VSKITRAAGSGGAQRRAGRNGLDTLKNGAARGTRTPDPVITNDVLYQLSYCGNTLMLQHNFAIPAASIAGRQSLSAINGKPDRRAGLYPADLLKSITK
jgi:hypothetical protein